MFFLRSGFLAFPHSKSFSETSNVPPERGSCICSLESHRCLGVTSESKRCVFCDVEYTLILQRAESEHLSDTQSKGHQNVSGSFIRAMTSLRIVNSTYGTGYEFE